jgi:hypothetical protein
VHTLPASFSLFILKIFGDILNFVAPLILGGLVECMQQTCTQSKVEHEKGCTSARCILLASLLVGTAVAKAGAGSIYTYNMSCLVAKAYLMLASAPMTAVLHSPSLRTAAHGEGATLCIDFFFTLFCAR